MRFLGLVASSLLGTVTAQGLTAPTCQASAPNQTRLDQVRTAMTNALPGLPFGLVYAAQAGYAFVSLSAATLNEPSTLGILNTTSFPPVLAHEIVLNDTRLLNAQALGVALSHSGKYIFITGGAGAYILDAARAIKGAANSIVGVLSGNQTITGTGAIQVTLTHDDAFAFISQEYGNRTGGIGNIDVFKLRYSADTVSGESVGFINLGESVVGSALSPNGKYLYVTSEAAGTNYTSAGLAPANHGILSVLSVSTLTTNPKEAQISNVTAGCEPVREIVSSNGKIVWVSARASNQVLGFNASALVHNPANALLASVQVGTEPVGLTFVHNEKRIISADSDRYNLTGAHTGLTVIDVEAASSGSKNAGLGYIPTGLFPREFAVSHDKKTLLVADHDSKQIQAVDLTTLP